MARQLFLTALQGPPLTLVAIGGPSHDFISVDPWTRIAAPIVASA